MNETHYSSFEWYRDRCANDLVVLLLLCVVVGVLAPFDSFLKK